QSWHPNQSIKRVDIIGESCIESVVKIHCIRCIILVVNLTGIYIRHIHSVGFLQREGIRFVEEIACSQIHFRTQFVGIVDTNSICGSYTISGTHHKIGSSASPHSATAKTTSTTTGTCHTKQILTTEVLVINIITLGYDTYSSISFKEI